MTDVTPRLISFRGFLLAGLLLGACTGRGLSPGSALPPGLVKGAQFEIAISSGGGIGRERLAVIETAGTWVHADVISSHIWGKGDIWVNLDSAQFGYVNVIGNPPAEN